MILEALSFVIPGCVKSTTDIK